MNRVVSVVVLLACSTWAAAPTWNDWRRTSDVGDRAFAAGKYADAEKSYREALRVGAELRGSPDVDMNLGRLATVLVAQGRCVVSGDEDPALSLLVALHRGDVQTTREQLEAFVKPVPKDACHSTVMHDALALSLWLEGREADARRVLDDAATLRCKSVKPDSLESGLRELNVAWTMPAEATSAKKRAITALGRAHPLIALFAAKSAGKTLPAPAPCGPVK